MPSANSQKIINPVLQQEILETDQTSMSMGFRLSVLFSGQPMDVEKSHILVNCWNMFFAFSLNLEIKYVVQRERKTSHFEPLFILPDDTLTINFLFLQRWASLIFF
jgi:hypothetical protein